MWQGPGGARSQLRFRVGGAATAAQRSESAGFPRRVIPPDATLTCLPFLPTMGHSRSASQDVYDEFYELVVRFKDCSYEDAGVKLQDHLCRQSADGSPNSTRRRSPTDSPRGGAGPSKGVGCSARVGTDSWPTTEARRPVGGGTATPSAGAVRYECWAIKRETLG